MIKISRTERFQLEEKYGFKVGREIHRTYSKPKHYYLIESGKCLNAINKIRGK